MFRVGMAWSSSTRSKEDGMPEFKKDDVFEIVGDPAEMDLMFSLFRMQNVHFTVQKRGTKHHKTLRN